VVIEGVYFAGSSVSV